MAVNGGYHLTHPKVVLGKEEANDACEARDEEGGHDNVAHDTCERGREGDQVVGHVAVHGIGNQEVQHKVNQPRAGPLEDRQVQYLCPVQSLKMK